MLKILSWVLFFAGLASLGFAGYELVTWSNVIGVPRLPYRVVPMTLIGAAFVAAGVYLQYTPADVVLKLFYGTRDSKTEPADPV